MSIGMYLLYSRYLALVNTLSSFKPVQNIIGKVTPFTQNIEDILSSNKEFVDAMIIYLDHRLALENGKLHDK